MPSRVIDIGTKQPISFVRLHWTEENEVGQYAALSYCWGGEPPIKSTSSTVQDFTDGIRFSWFPQTLQDAMVVANKLGIRYIWIDCICIIQDDPEDVSREIGKMPSIFQEAYITISASSARNVQEGFLQPRPSVSKTCMKLPFETPAGKSGSILIEEPHRYTPEKNPISLRAWTLSEHILSPRILDYGSEDVWWICGSTKTSLDDEPMDVSTDQSQNKQFSLDSWRSTLRDYTRRFLTFPGDKFPAISGVAADFGAVYQSDYLAGLWKSALPKDLLWSSARSDISRPTVHRAPSWSWAAVDGEVSYKWCPTSFSDPAIVIDCRATPASLDAPYGALNPTLSAYLKIQGLMKRFKCGTTRQRLIEVATIEDPTNATHIGRAQGDADEKLPVDEYGWSYVWALVVVENPMRGLLLVPVREGYYRRVGLFYRLWGEGLEGFETDTITII
ncbi:HET-domain-containing protein [Lophium mytilinum]|uniref:HET-domain-containing protein n=1 Tax=Lophium mytilinum TaxID=390894 RepID=A0A6A6RAX1_9PEZI|nr:HET-domain-containing protein [Lophium mytilinum]